MDRIILHWPRLGPYHLARLRGADALFAKHNVKVTALEIAGLDRTYGWERQSGPTSFERVTLFPNEYYEDVTWPELKTTIFHALDDFNPTAVSINGYGFPDSQACLDWCWSRKRAAILMSETTLADKPRGFLLEKAKRLIVRGFSAAVCGGKLHREYLLTLGVPAYRIFTKYDVVDNDYFSSDACSDSERDALPGLCARAAGDRASGLLHDSSPFFLAANRFVARKNLDGLLTAYRIYRHTAKDGWRLVLLGSGDEEERLRHRVEQEKIPDVCFAGFRQTDEIRCYYGAAGCFIHPAFVEPWGLVVNEAMAAGLPVLVSNGVGCAPDLVQPGKNGLLFDPTVPAQLADQMKMVAADATLRAEMSQHSHKIIGDWTIHHFARSLWEAFNVPRNSYRLVYFGGRKLLGYPDETPARKLEKVRRIETFTVRRRLAFNTVRAAIFTRVDDISFRRTTLDDPKFVSAEVWRGLRQIEEQLPFQVGNYTFAWPFKREPQRTYVYVFDRQDKARAFVKLSEEGEAAALANEFKMLQSIADATHPRFRYPKPLVFSTVGNLSFHVTECVPLAATARSRALRDVETRDCIESYAGGRVAITPKQLGCIDWFENFRRSIDHRSSFAQLVEQDRQLGAICQRVHGDLTVANLIYSGEQIWIVDWELSHETGPRLTDLITFFLGERQRLLTRRPFRVFTAFRKTFIDNRSESQRAEARLALAYLYAVNSGLGRAIVEMWNQTNS